VFVSLGIVDVARLAHVVLEVLPGDGRRQILDDQSVVGSGRDPAVSWRWSTVSAASAAAAPVAALARPPGVLDHKPVAVKATAVQLVNSVLSIPRIVELDESISLLDDDISDATKAFEELLQVPFFTSRVSEAPHEDSSTHGQERKTKCL